MNVTRGLLRVWVLMSCLWIAGVGVLSYNDIKKGDAFSGRYQFVLVFKEGINIFSANKREDFIAPRSIEGGPQFSAIQNRYYQIWTKSVLDGTRVRHELPDGTWLYLLSYFSEDDQDYLKKQFWSQRWGRWFGAVWGWALFAFGVPIAVFVLGRGVLWAVSGFRA